MPLITSETSRALHAKWAGQAAQRAYAARGLDSYYYARLKRAANRAERAQVAANPARVVRKELDGV